MTRAVVRKIAVLAAGAFLTGAAHAQPDKAPDDLQGQCGRRAAQRFQKEWGGSAGSANIVANYESHYSPRFNKCFYLETSTTAPRAALDKTNFNTLRLYDLNENKQYGTFIEAAPLHVCKVQDTPCSSEAEWRVLVKSFMEE